MKFLICFRNQLSISILIFLYDYMLQSDQVQMKHTFFSLSLFSLSLYVSLSFFFSLYLSVSLTYFLSFSLYLFISSVSIFRTVKHIIHIKTYHMQSPPKDPQTSFWSNNIINVIFLRCPPNWTTVCPAHPAHSPTFCPKFR